MAVTDLGDAAEEILALAEFLIADTSGGALERSYVAIGDPPFDCSQLTVQTSVGERVTGIPGIKHKTGRENEVTFSIKILRCRPLGDDGNPPAVADLQAYATESHQDAWAVWNGLMAAQRAGTLLEGYCQSVEFDFAQPLPNSDLGGWEIVFRGVLYAYTPNLPIPPAQPPLFLLLEEDGTSHLILEEGDGSLLLEESP